MIQVRFRFGDLTKCITLTLNAYFEYQVPWRSYSVHLHLGEELSAASALHIGRPDHSTESYIRIADMNSFLSLIPRGLQYVAQDILKETLEQPGYELQLNVRGERQHQKAIDVPTLTTTLRANIRNGRKYRSRECIESTCLRPAGVVKVDSRDVAIGYECYGDDGSSEQMGHHGCMKTRLIWSEPGQLRGMVWLEFVTNAPVDLVLSIRILGPLLVLVNIWDDEENLVDSKQSLEVTTKALRTILKKRNDYSFEKALMTWQECRHCSPRMSLQNPTEDNALEGAPGSLRYRLSCLRDDSKKFSYSREELLTGILDSVIPSNECTSTWSVDLKNFDLEVVLLLRCNALAIGFSAHNYPLHSAKSFAAGVMPSDLSPPYLSGQLLSDIVRLRPSTAQLLLRLANLQFGDVLLDPCAGIGTIPLETMLPGNIPVVAIGGDIELSPCSRIHSIAARYQALARHVQRTNHSSSKSVVAELLGLDAGYLPFRAESVDVVVSDLPFGQQCLSSAKLDGLIPLLIGELSRIVRRNTGRMVLLCGNHIPVLNALRECNERTNSKIWQLPCTAVLPVNIGGFLAWIVRVHRGSSESVRLKRHVDRVRKIVKKRVMILAPPNNSELQRGRPSL